MFNLQRIVATVLVALTLSPSIAAAKNFCVTGFPNANFIMVGKGFTIHQDKAS
jgi:hypothetical protein